MTGNVGITRQEIFNRVWDHFITKNAPFGWDEMDQVCTYGGHGAPPCAIGIFDTNNVLENFDSPVTNLDRVVLQTVFGENEDWLGENLLFLRGIQMAHDVAARYKEKAEMKSQLIEIAVHYNLEAPV